MRRLLYIGSPNFDGIGLLNTEAQILQRDGALTILDGIALGVYPEIKNFGHLDHLVWRWVRRRQFFSALKPDGLEYLQVNDILNNEVPTEHNIVSIILNEAIHDHCVCNNITGAKALTYRKRNWNNQYAFLSRCYDALHVLLHEKKFGEIVVFNGRNALAKLLVAVAKEQSLQVRWLEYFGKRDDMMTYISSPVDIFDFDAMSDFILEAYRACRNPKKDRIAQDCLSDRVTCGDPLLLKWGVNFSGSHSTKNPRKKIVAAFFFSSEDEYPAVKSSVFGFSPPTEQYRTFLLICKHLVKLGLQHDYCFYVKLHPRYAAEKDKLHLAQREWNYAISEAQSLGIDFELLEPLSSAYKIIEKADIVFSYGSTAWEGTFIGKPAVLMGPNFFATHDCAYVANSVEDVIAFLRSIPQPKPIENCYPYAWAWRELGRDAQNYQAEARDNFFPRMTKPFRNRFSVL